MRLLLGYCTVRIIQKKILRPFVSSPCNKSETLTLEPYMVRVSDLLHGAGTYSSGYVVHVATVHVVPTAVL